MPDGVQLHLGDHVCAFYRSPAERDAILVPFLTDGLRAGEKCTCIVDSATPAEILAKVAQYVALDRYTSVEQLEVLDSEGTYLAGGGPLSERMLRFWESRAATAAHPCTRNIGDMSWAHRGRIGVADLVAYESELNRILARLPQVTMCLYDLSRCSGELIMDVLKTHPKALLGSMVIDNPYYVAPS